MSEPPPNPRTRGARILIALPLFLVTAYAIYLFFGLLAWAGLFGPVIVYPEPTVWTFVGLAAFWILVVVSIGAVGWWLWRWVTKV
ncbi:hypothetical protein [Agromyces bracchium]|uniref:Uncharacterized protein n=1 Tax=Agromyces bracchium TaxID=88376 RepID=A0A6I3M8Q7_9MICO|nr:hypothetical protein [Agromyces bracchium]MTH68502.1 hypothetical protein [Agromyces bracchium]